MQEELLKACEQQETTTYTYDPQNRLIGIKNPEGHTTRYTFTPGGKHIKNNSPCAFCHNFV